MLRVFATFPTGQSFYSYIKRLSDGLYYDDNDQTFKAFGSLIDGKIEFVEDANVSGEYSWEKDIEDGEFVIYTKQSPGDTNAAHALNVTIKFGNEVSQATVVHDNSGVIELEIVESC